jgi:hypothetical protein
MKGKKIISYGEEIPVKLTLLQRDLILEHTTTGPELTGRLRRAPIESRHVIVHYSLDDLDELAGCIASEARETRNQKLRRQMESLWEKLMYIEESYVEEEG